MFKQFTILIFALLFFNVNYAQVVINEDFSTATGTTPPTGWANLDLSGSGFVWAFDNPGFRTLEAPITDPAAIFDSDEYAGSSEGDSSTLESPVFDASNTSEHFYLSFDHYFDDGSGGEYHVDVFDGTTWNDVLSGTVYTNNPQHESFEITSALAGTANGQIRFRWIGNDSWYWIVDNIKLEKTTCPPISGLQFISSTTNTATISWTPNGAEAAWSIEWGVPGFQPGTGNEIGSATATATTHIINGLNPSTNYDVWVAADCSGNYTIWIPVEIQTQCGSQSIPWYENFDQMTSVDYDVFPNCWTSENGEWMTDDQTNTIQSPYSGSNFAAIEWSTDDYLWTPGFDLVAGNTYEFSFMWAGDDYTGWDGSVVVNSSQTSSGATQLGVPFVSSADAPATSYQKAVYCFVPTTSGTYNFAIHVSADSNPYNLAFDDFSVIQRGSSAGIDGTTDICQIGGLVDLNSIITINDTTGAWSFDFNPNAIVNDTMLNPQYIPSGAIDVLYTTSGCLQDTAVAHITIYDASNAGQDGNISTCRNQPVDLLSGLNGTIDLGGDWYGPSGSMLQGSAITAPNLAGQYNYEYIVGNGVCPNDTASIVLTATSCNYLGLDENTVQALSVYPNPSKGTITISTSENITGTLQIMDAQGKLIQTLALTNTNTSSVDLTGYTNGVYFLKVNSDQINTLTRVIKE